jgi:hypothetical protein
MSYLVEESIMAPGADTDRGGLPLGAGAMRTVRKFETDEARDKFADARAAQEAAEEKMKQMRSLMESFEFFNKHKHTVRIETGGAHVDTGFPCVYAAYCQMVEDYHASESAEFFASDLGARSVVTDMSHIPDDHEIKAKVRAWMSQNGSDSSAFGGQKVARVVVGHGSQRERDIAVEAELSQPLKLTPGTELRVVVQGGSGTDGSAKRTCVITSEMLLNGANTLMTHRLAIIDTIREFVETTGRGGQNCVSPLPQLNTSIAFLMSDSTDSAGAVFSRNEPICFQGADHAILTNFKLATFEGVPSLVSVTVAIRFVAP